MMMTIRVIIMIMAYSLSTSPIWADATRSEDVGSAPKPKPWPEQFHATIFTNYSGALQMVDLWYDWPNGRNLNIEQDQLAQLPLYNVEWTNGTSFFFTQAEDPYCQIVSFDVGILRPNWMDAANYLGQRHMDGFLCNVWEKADGFIWYYEDVLSKRPVYWLLFSGKEAHFMTFEVGAVLEDTKWQAPAYCFQEKTDAVTDMELIYKPVDMIRFQQKEKSLTNGI